MAKTAIQLVNDVAGNLRRKGPTGVTAYTTLTQDFDAVFLTAMVNLAKREVESRWKWDCLRSTVTFDTVAATRTYDTSVLATVSSDPVVTTNRSYLLYDRWQRPMFWDVTSGHEGRIVVRPRDDIEHIAAVVPTQQIAIPGMVAVYQTGAGLTVNFGYLPSGIRSYSFKAIIPQADFSVTTTEILVPHEPVVLLATAMCLEERGEEFGGSPERWHDKYDECLGSIIGPQVNAEDMVMRRV